MKTIHKLLAVCLIAAGSVVGLGGGVSEATMSSCHSWFLSSYAGAYAWCDSGTGGSVRVKIWCNNGVQYFGPKVYAPHQTSTKLCPSGVGVNASTYILGT